MERLSHDLNLALEQSNCNKGRKKLGLRRRTRSTGNLPAYCLGGTNEDCSSSSPPQAAIVSQVFNALSDSDDPQLNQLQQGSVKNRVSHFCPAGNFESDSFNENFSPAKPPNARRKRKFKKMAVDYVENCNDQASPPLLISQSSHINITPNNILTTQGSSPFTLFSKKKRIFKHNCQEGYRSNVYCGKRKWGRERSEIGEMRERSFSGGCASKAYFCGKNTSKSFLEFKNTKKFLPIDKVPKFKDKIIPVKSGFETTLKSLSCTTPSLPGSSSFNFVYKPPNTNNTTSVIFGKPNTSKSANIFSSPFFLPNDVEPLKGQNSKSSKKNEKSHRKHKSHRKSASNQPQLRNPLQFDDLNVEMDCSNVNDLVSSSSISSSDSEGVVTNDSDREGDDELTDWPGNEEISSFNKNLNLKGTKPVTNGSLKTIGQQIQKPAIKKDKFLPKQGLSSCKNKTDLSLEKTENKDPGEDLQLMDDDTMMSDSGSVLDTFAHSAASPNVDAVDSSTLTQTFTSFADVKNAGLLNNNANEAFFHSFQSFQENPKTSVHQENEQYTPRTNFSLQKTSSSDFNLSEKSPQSDHCYSEHSVYFAPPAIREIRAGCRRIRDERPGFAILSAANEQLSKFLQNSYQYELRLPCIGNDPEEQEKLASLAKLYSLEMSVELGRPVLRKTSNTTQPVKVECQRLHCQKILSDFKRRCYGSDCPPDPLFPSVSLDICNSPDPKNQQLVSIDPEMCVPSASNSICPHESFPVLAKVPTSDDLSQSQDYDQGFSSLGNSPPLDASDELKSHYKSDGGFSSDGS